MMCCLIGSHGTFACLPIHLPQQKQPNVGTWNPLMTLVFIGKGPLFGGFNPQNRGQTACR